MMLQQTQVSRVINFYTAWLRQFPDWKSLANASNADVIKAWAGLGYNRRALALRDIAKQVIKNGIPKNRDEWLKLKGVGPYTSAALAIFSLKQKELPIDTNIRRTLGRLLLGIPYPQSKDDASIELTAKELLENKGFCDIPQALFDLASSYCAKVPNCLSCPMQSTCKASDVFLSGDVITPRRMTVKSKEKIHRNKKFPDRIYRGRILKLTRESIGVKIVDVGDAIDNTFDIKFDNDWLASMIERMKNDQLISIKSNSLYLKD